MKHPGLLGVTLGITEEVDTVKSSHCGSSRREISFPFMWTRRNDFVQQGNNAFDLFNQVFWVLFVSPRLVGVML
jgi:hypothetical protein